MSRAHSVEYLARVLSTHIAPSKMKKMAHQVNPLCRRHQEGPKSLQMSVSNVHTQYSTLMHMY